MFAEVLLNGSVREVSADNAAATVTLPAVNAQRWFLGGVEAHYDPSVSALKTITVSYTHDGVPRTKTYRWDFAKGPFVHNFPLLIHGDYNTAVTVTLTASGAGGTLGTMAVWAALV